MTNAKRSTVTLLSILILWGPYGHGAKGSQASEQLEFSAEDSGVRNPVVIPRDVLAILSTNKMVSNALEDQNMPADKMPASWFSASAVHLSNSGTADLVVVAEGRLAGANVTTFWIFRATPHGHDLVLSEPAHDLRVKSTHSKGYRDIEPLSATAIKVLTVRCRFDGQRYLEYRSTLAPIQ